MYNSKELHNINYNPKYGSNWIITDKQSTQTDTTFKLYPTGDANINTGRIYIALPANKILTAYDKQKYNIII